MNYKFIGQKDLFVLLLYSLVVVVGVPNLLLKSWTHNYSNNFLLTQMTTCVLAQSGLRFLRCLCKTKSYLPNPAAELTLFILRHQVFKCQDVAKLVQYSILLT